MTNKELAAQCLIEAAELLNEGAVKTNKKKKLDKYLSKYDYKGNNKSGTITVDGKEYKIDRDTNNKYIETSLGKTIRQLGADISNDNEDKIYLDKNFKNLKNDKRRDAILQHEIGHLKHHKYSGKNSTSAHRDAIIDNAAKDLSYQSPYHSEFIKESLKSNFPDKSKKQNELTEKDKIKIENLKKLKKYEGGQHQNRTEYEADAYASVHKNGDQLKRTIREMYKHNKKDKVIKDQLKSQYKAADPENYHPEYIDDNYIAAVKKQQNILGDADKKARSKALKDKSINKNVYRESIELLLDEAIELLEKEN